MTAPPRRPWWKKKRTWAAVTLWLVVAYPLSAGPAQLAVARGWVSVREYLAFYAPLGPAVRATDAGNRWFTAYGEWWWRIFSAKAASD